MARWTNKWIRLLEKCQRQVECYANALRFGFVFVRSRGFQLPRSIRVAGRSVTLHFPPDKGVSEDFFICVVRNEYGLGHGLSSVQTVVDIGANVGFFSMAARERYPDAIIHAYEPNPRVLPSLRSNTEGLQIRVFPEAVGGQSGFVSLLDSGDSNQARTSAGDGSIPMVSLATVLERLGRPLDLLKLDCEGAEWEMFPLKECWQQIHNVRMEYHLFHGETVSQLEQILLELGFRPTRWRHDVGFGTVWASHSRS